MGEQLRPPKEDCSTLSAVTVIATGTHTSYLASNYPTLPPSHYCPFLLGLSLGTPRTNPDPVKDILMTVATAL